MSNTNSLRSNGRPSQPAGQSRRRTQISFQPLSPTQATSYGRPADYTHRQSLSGAALPSSYGPTKGVDPVGSRRSMNLNPYGVAGTGPATGNASTAARRRNSVAVPIKTVSTRQSYVANPSEFEAKIRVCVRKRPLSAREVSRTESDIIQTTGRRTLTVHEPKVKVDLTKYVEKHTFMFDEVFDEATDNEELYQRTAMPLVRFIFQGGNATCFAYGQTGSGKTYTMLDPRSGLYVLAASDIFTMHAQPEYQHLAVLVSFYEIYQSQLYDLLNSRKKLHAREDSRQQVCIAGLREVEIENVYDLMEIFNFGNAERSTGSTGANADSSRSHAILQIILRDSEGDRLHGKFSFIDLAGSERGADRGEANKQTRMEGSEINKSLLALKECIRALDLDKKHTPFRQSKLTQVLKDSLVGNARTCMIATVSPNISNSEHSLNTLRYTDRVKAIKGERGADTDSGYVNYGDEEDGEMGYDDDGEEYGYGDEEGHDGYGHEYEDEAYATGEEGPYESGYGYEHEPEPASMPSRHQPPPQQQAAESRATYDHEHRLRRSERSIQQLKQPAASSSYARYQPTKHDPADSYSHGEEHYYECEQETIDTASPGEDDLEDDGAESLSADDRGRSQYAPERHQQLRKPPPIASDPVDDYGYESILEETPAFSQLTVGGSGPEPSASRSSHIRNSGSTLTRPSSLRSPPLQPSSSSTGGSAFNRQPSQSQRAPPLPSSNSQVTTSPPTSSGASNQYAGRSALPPSGLPGNRYNLRNRANSTARPTLVNSATTTATTTTAADATYPSSSSQPASTSYPADMANNRAANTSPETAAGGGGYADRSMRRLRQPSVRRVATVDYGSTSAADISQPPAGSEGGNPGNSATSLYGNSYPSTQGAGAFVPPPRSSRRPTVASGGPPSNLSVRTSPPHSNYSAPSPSFSDSRSPPPPGLPPPVGRTNSSSATMLPPPPLPPPTAPSSLFSSSTSSRPPPHPTMTAPTSRGSNNAASNGHSHNPAATTGNSSGLTFNLQQIDDFVAQHRLEIRETSEFCKLETRLVASYTLGTSSSSSSSLSTGINGGNQRHPRDLNDPELLSKMHSAVSYLEHLDEILERKQNAVVQLRNSIRQLVYDQR